MALTIVTVPATEPITLAEARAHLRLDASAGEIAPTEPTAALAGDGAGNVEDGVHRYRVTFVTADGETEGGTISDALTVVDKTSDGKVAISAIPLGGSIVTSRNVYRTVADGSDYKLLTAIADNTTTTYTDNTADAGLGAGCPTTNTTEDPTLNALITTARKAVEGLTERSFVTQTWDWFLDAFPASDFEVPLPPLQVMGAIGSIKYYNTAGVETTWAATNYSLDTDSEPGRISRAYGVSYPSTRVMNNAVTVRFVAGYGVASAVPQPIKQAILILLAHWYEQRDPVEAGGNVAPVEIPLMVATLLAPYSRVTL